MHWEEVSPWAGPRRGRAGTHGADRSGERDVWLRGRRSVVTPPLAPSCSKPSGLSGFIVGVCPSVVFVPLFSLWSAGTRVNGPHCHLSFPSKNFRDFRSLGRASPPPQRRSKDGKSSRRRGPWRGDQGALAQVCVVPAAGAEHAGRLVKETQCHSCSPPLKGCRPPGPPSRSPLS